MSLYLFIFDGPHFFDLGRLFHSIGRAIVGHDHFAANSVITKSGQRLINAESDRPRFVKAGDDDRNLDLVIRYSRANSRTALAHNGI
jgi:hypothetical protein